MSVEKIMSDWKNQSFRPVYWLEGEEDYFIDQLVNYAEHNILNEPEAEFNLTVFYGKDANWAEVINACKRYPMFAERQVVILKEAQQMRELEKLESYIQNPLASTILVVSYKEKKVDARTKFAKLLKEKGELFSTKKMYDNQLPNWTNNFVQSRGYSIQPKALHLLVEHIGNDLSRIANEIEKLLINIGKRKEITEDDIETYVGISKEYNVFELQSAIMQKDLSKAVQIIQYFEGNPKAAPIQQILPVLYNFFSKVYMVYGLPSNDDKTIAAGLGVNPFFVKDFKIASVNYDFLSVQKNLLLLHEYNLRSIGVNDSGTPDASLLKELLFKIVN
ncbi:MAG: DNA polymerase III subunit delta [Sphingobacteriales bacterium]|nr:MAG: DNA polymerase III subunit delta [Sphingobacteriales bacterium]